MLAQYILHDKEMLWYIEYILHRLEKTKIALRNISLLTPSYIDQPLTIQNSMQLATLFSVFRIMIV